MRTSSLHLLLLAGLCCRPGVSHANPFEVTGTLLTLPRSPHCAARQIAVTARYRVDRAGRGAARGLAPGDELYVVHLCPAHHRGWSRDAQGSAGPLRPGDRHQLLLAGPERRPAHGDAVDPFPPPAPRYRALRTDEAPPLPLISVRVTGPAGAARALEFEQRTVTVGRAEDADVRLDDPSVEPLHLRLVADPMRLQVAATAAPGAVVMLDGGAIARPALVSPRSRVAVGPYALRVTVRGR